MFRTTVAALAVLALAGTAYAADSTSAAPQVQGQVKVNAAPAAKGDASTKSAVKVARNKAAHKAPQHKDSAKVTSGASVSAGGSKPAANATVGAGAATTH